MKKFFENKPRAWFLFGFILVLTLTLTGVIVGIKQKGEVVETKTETKELVELSQQEIRDNLDRVSINGTVEKKTEDIIIIKTTKGSQPYNITDKTIISKGVSAQKAVAEEIKEGMTVFLQISESTKNIISIWWED